MNMELSPEEKKLLLLLRWGSPIISSLLRQYLRVSYPVALRIRKRLEREGLIRVRRAGPAKLIELTEDGERIADELYLRMREELNNYTTTLHHHKMLFASALTDNGIRWEYFEIRKLLDKLKIRVRIGGQDYEFTVPMLNTGEAIKKYHEIARQLKAQIGG